MRNTPNIEGELHERAAELTLFKEKTLLIRRGFESLIAIES